MNYVFFISQNLSQRNYDRLGIKILKEKKINYKILDLSDIFDKQISLLTKKFETIRKDKNYFKFDNFKDLFVFLRKQKKMFFFSNMCSYSSFWLSIIERYIVAKGNIKVHFSVALIPIFTRNLFLEFITMLFRFRFFKIIKSCLNFFKNRLAIFIRPAAKFAFVSGNYEKMKFNKKETKIINSNCLDYNLIIKLKKNDIKKKYIVFLDQNIINHPDYALSNSKNKWGANMNQTLYWSRIKNYLNSLAIKKKKKIIICLHPKNSLSDHLFLNKYFAKEKNIAIKKKNTVKYIAQAFIVVGHASTAFQFAICLYKKIILIKFKDLKRPEHQSIDFFLRELKHKIFDSVDGYFSIELSVRNYKQFKQKYICSSRKKSTDISWNRLYDYLKGYEKKLLR